MEKNTKLRLFIKSIFPTALVIILIYTVVICFLLYQILLIQAKNNLNKTTSRIREDIIFKDGKWDLSHYNADSNIVDNNPLYIITTEGVILERSRPINGLLDLSRFTSINQYLFPTTIDTIANEKWRVLASPINSGDQAIGIIFTSFYQPDDSHIQQIDQNLQQVINTINADISVNGDLIDISRVDSRKIPYDINFQIVTRFNKVVFQSNNNNSITRMPTNIDRSYVDNQLKGERYKQVADASTKKAYLTSTIPILNDNNLTSGIIVTAVPIDDIYQTLEVFVALSLLIGLVMIIAMIPICFKIFNSIQSSIQKKIIQKPTPKVINFMRQECKLVIDGEGIDIPYASFQYYFCQALIQKPQKKWEADELLEIFGEEMGGEKWRKVYDTMIGINKKTSHLVEKLFVVKDKRYYFNPIYIKIASYTNT